MFKLLFQVILVGEYGAGKSSLFRRFASNHFVTATDRASTMGLDNYGKVYQIGGKAIKLQVRFQEEKKESRTKMFFICN